MKLVKKKSILEILTILLILFLIALPKGGFRINYMPITWGYLFLGIISFFCLFRKKYILKKDRIYLLLFMIPFQIYSLISITINGIENIGFAFSFFISFFFLPFIFLFVLAQYIDSLEIDFFFKILKRSILFVATYGILLFFYKLFFGKFFEIPFLTINFHERGLIETTKSSDRGTLFKLISTYNNGNIYGLSILMLYPLYSLLEKKFFKRFIVFLSLILTLSRTVWIGLIISEFLYRFFIKKDKLASFFKYFFSLIFFLICIFLIFEKMNYPIDWFYDKTLGNRINPAFFDLKIFSSKPFCFIEEMQYFSILNIFGFTGLIFFIIYLFSPVYLYFFKNRKKSISQIDKSILSGLVSYLIISFGDGAILYIPIMAFYFFLSSFLFKEKNLKLIETI